MLPYIPLTGWPWLELNGVNGQGLCVWGVWRAPLRGAVERGRTHMLALYFALGFWEDSAGQASVSLLLLRMGLVFVISKFGSCCLLPETQVAAAPPPNALQPNLGFKETRQAGRRSVQVLC